MMNPADTVPRWNGQPLRDNLIGLSWPDRAQPGSGFAAAGEGRVVLIPDGGFPAFLSAHPNATFVVDFARSHDFDATNGAVNQVVIENRLHDIGLLSGLVRFAAPRGDRSPQHYPVRGDWLTDSERLRAEANGLLYLARDARSRIEDSDLTGPRFGLLGIGLDMRGALAAMRGVVGVRVSEPAITRVREAIARRQQTARCVLESIPAARELANKDGCERFLSHGDPGDNTGAFATFISKFIQQIRLRDQLPVPTPDDIFDRDSWDLLGPHSQTITAWLELVRSTELLTALDSGEPLQPSPLAFPNLRWSGPNLTYLRRWAGSGVLSPPSSEFRFVVICIPDLELRALAVCLARRFTDGTLSRRIKERDVAGLQQELIRRESGLEGDELISHAQKLSREFKTWTALAKIALEYFPLGVTNHNIEDWLCEYESGFTPRANEVKHAWDALAGQPSANGDAGGGLVPSLRRYCCVDAVRLVATNLGTTQEGLEAVLSIIATDLSLDPNQTDVVRAINILRDGGGSSDRLFSFFTSRRYFPQNPLATRPFLDAADLVKAMLDSDYISPTGRMYGAVAPVQVVGRDHLELADGVRKAAYYAIVAGGHRIAGFSRNEFAVLIPEQGTTKPDVQAIAELVKTALAGWADEIAGSVAAKVSSVW